jgi:hypothetical protein
MTSKILNAAIDVPVDNTPTPTTTHYQQLANDFSNALDALVTILPRLELKHESTVGFVRSHVNVSLEFLETVIAAVERTPTLTQLNKVDLVQARDTLQFLSAFRVIVDRIDEVSKALKFTMDSRKANLSADALQIYAIAKGVARDAGSADVAIHVQNMKRDLGRAKALARTKSAKPLPGTPAAAA